jgi:geranylgeranyl diphosphate synthase type I
LGKATGADIRRKKKSLPVLYSLTKANKSQRKRLERLYNTPEELGDAAVEEVMGILDVLDAHGYAQSVAEEMQAKATATAKEAELGPEAAASLNDLANFMVHRDH